MQAIAIVVLSTLAAVAYGIVHDQITARICIEYFTVGHPQVLSVPTESPTVLGFVWGVIATWWLGAGLGIPLALAGHIGRRPKVDAIELVRPVAVLMLAAGAFAAAAGTIGFLIAWNGWLVLDEALAERIAPSHRDGFIADTFAHSASYLAGFVGGLLLIVCTWRIRGKRSA